MSQFAARRIFRPVTQATETRRSLEIRGLPKTALPSDVRRLCVNTQIENIGLIAIDYKRFEPTGSAWVTLTSPSFLRHAVQNLHGAVISGHPIMAAPVDKVGRDFLPRTRGVKGRMDAVQRGIFLGNGPGGGITDSGKNAVLYGLPGRMTEEAAGYYLKNFKLASSSGTKDIVKLEVNPTSLSLTARFLVRLETEAEAYRLVRKLHETYYEPEVFDNRYRVRARVIH